MTRLTALLTGAGSPAAKAATTEPRRWLLPNLAGDGPMEVEVLVGDARGRIIGQLDADVAGVAWKLNDYGQARLTLSPADVDEPLIRFGNRLLIRFNNGLPDWGGVIDPPRNWRDGRVEVVGYSGEYLLGWRITDRGRYFTQATAGEIFRAIIREAEPFGMEVGVVWSGGDLHSPDYHYSSLYDIVRNSITRRLEAVDWDVRVRVVGDTIRFVANLYERRGQDWTGPAGGGHSLAFVEGINASGSVSEQGPIHNDVYLAGAGTGWGPEARVYARAYDDNSVALFGLRQAGETRVDIETQESIDNAAEIELAEASRPRPVVSLTAWDRPPARYVEYDVGDTLWAEMSLGGVGGIGQAVRVTAREFLPATGLANLVVQ